MSAYNILAVRLDHRVKNAINFQSIITEYGCSIRVRLDIHEADEGICSIDGLIILQVISNEKELLEKLNNTQGITAKLIEI